MTSSRSALRLLQGLLVLLTVAPFRLATAQDVYYQPNPAAWLGGDPSWDDTPANFSSYFPITYVIFGIEGMVDVRSIVAEESDCPTAHNKSSAVQFEVVDGANGFVRANGKLINNNQLPYRFPVQVCSITTGQQTTFRDALATGDVVLSYQNMTFDRIPLVKRNPKRFLLTGDTGLRSKPTNLGLGDLKTYPCNASEVYGIDQCYLNFTQDNLTETPTGSFQGTDEWHFKSVADDAATRDIDCIVYVGDYLYRQGPCPADSYDTFDKRNKNCSGINFPVTADAGELPAGDIMNFLPGNYGDNWWGWWADFFWPAMNLLQASPLIPTRGNHEICSRGGYGYFFFLAPQELCPDCSDQLDELCSQSAEPYAVTFENEQFLVMDDALISPYEGGIDHFIFNEGKCPGPPDGDGEKIVAKQEERTLDIEDAAASVAFFTQYMDTIEEFSKTYDNNFYVGHRPLFAVACNDTTMSVLDWTLQQSLGPTTLDRISAVISGHMHWFEVLEFQNNSLPSQLVVGHGGTRLIPNYVHPDIWSHMRLEVGQEGLGIAADVEWGLSVSQYGYAIMERDDDTQDYEVSFYFLNNETLEVDMMAGTSLTIPKGPRVPTTTDSDVGDDSTDTGMGNSSSGTDSGSSAPAPSPDGTTSAPSLEGTTTAPASDGRKHHVSNLSFILQAVMILLGCALL